MVIRRIFLPEFSMEFVAASGMDTVKIMRDMEKTNDKI